VLLKPTSKTLPQCTANVADGSMLLKKAPACLRHATIESTRQIS
jgi:hypothetical protein